MDKKLTEDNNLDTDLKILIADSIKKVLEDPDLGLELTDHMKGRLKRAEEIRKTIPFFEVKKKLKK